MDLLPDRPTPTMVSCDDDDFFVVTVYLCRPFFERLEKEEVVRLKKEERRVTKLGYSSVGLSLHFLQLEFLVETSRVSSLLLSKFHLPVSLLLNSIKIEEVKSEASR